MKLAIRGQAPGFRHHHHRCYSPGRIARRTALPSGAHGIDETEPYHLHHMRDTRSVLSNNPSPWKLWVTSNGHRKHLSVVMPRGSWVAGNQRLGCQPTLGWRNIGWVTDEF
jgi:hypothetical protein